MKIQTILLLLLAATLALGASGCGLIKGVLGGAAEEAGLGDLVDGVLNPDDEPAPVAEPSEPESPTAAPTDAPGAPVPAGEEAQGLGDLSPMEALDSYRSEFIQSTTVDGTVTESWTLTQEYTRDPQARRTVSNSTQGGLFEFIQFPDASYMNSDGEWMSFSADQDMTSWFPEPNAAGPDDLDNCESQGTDTVNGYAATHYVCDVDDDLEGLLALSGSVQSYQAETWVSEEFDIVVKTLITYSFTDEDNKTTEILHETNITSINGPLVIEAPEGVAPPGVAEDIPVLDGAEEQMSFMGMTVYEVAGTTVEEAVAWYTEQMPASGWTYDADNSVDESLVFTKEGRTTTVMIAAQDDGVSVTIVTGQQ